MNDFERHAIFLRKGGPVIELVDEFFSNASNSGNSKFDRDAVDRVGHILQNTGENVDLDRYTAQSIMQNVEECR